MRLTYIIVTHNRRQALLRTLGILPLRTPLPPEQWETWVVDNASTDGSAEAVARLFPEVRRLARRRNEGVSARSHAFTPARGEYIVLLDDDSYPEADAVLRSMEYMDAHPRTAAVVGRVVLPDGSLEAAALPAVMLSGAVCIRKSVLDQVGGFRREFFRKAGEYDLSFRMLAAGWTIERFEDLVYRHDKVLTGRSNALAHRMDLRNNLILTERFLPPQLRAVYRTDWRQRYELIARHAGHQAAARRAVWEARLWAWREEIGRRIGGRFRGQLRGRILSDEILEAVFGFRAQAQAIAQWSARLGIRRVVIADLGKNIYATWAGCRAAGLEVLAVADNAPAFSGYAYRGARIESDLSALQRQPQGVVLANVNPAQVDRRVDQLQQVFDVPVLRLWHPRTLAEAATPAASIGLEQNLRASA
jgi:GT2 family glycosyltransferase